MTDVWFVAEFPWRMGDLYLYLSSKPMLSTYVIAPGSTVMYPSTTPAAWSRIATELSSRRVER